MTGATGFLGKGKNKISREFDEARARSLRSIFTHVERSQSSQKNWKLNPSQKCTKPQTCLRFG